ncbi:MAG: hypothetical protein NVV83_10525 [Afipia sp.]|nr:hypothetical protein [Afipia sp.]
MTAHSTADAGRPALPNLARQFDLMAKGCRAHGLDSWEDHFFRLYEEARNGTISADDIAETIAYDFRNDNDGKAAATQIITALIADVSGLAKILEAVKQACLIADDDGISITSDPHISEDLFSHICAALAAAKGAK